MTGITPATQPSAQPNTYTLDYTHSVNPTIDRSFDANDYDYVVTVNCTDIVISGGASAKIHFIKSAAGDTIYGPVSKRTTTNGEVYSGVNDVEKTLTKVIQDAIINTDDTGALAGGWDNVTKEYIRNIGTFDYLTKVHSGNVDNTIPFNAAVNSIITFLNTSYNYYKHVEAGTSTICLYGTDSIVLPVRFYHELFDLASTATPYASSIPGKRDYINVAFKLTLNKSETRFIIGSVLHANTVLINNNMSVEFSLSAPTIDIANKPFAQPTKVEMYVAFLDTKYDSKKQIVFTINTGEQEWYKSVMILGDVATQFILSGTQLQIQNASNNYNVYKLVINCNRIGYTTATNGNITIKEFDGTDIQNMMYLNKDTLSIKGYL